MLRLAARRRRADAPRAHLVLRHLEPRRRRRGALEQRAIALRELVQLGKVLQRVERDVPIGIRQRAQVLVATVVGVAEVVLDLCSRCCPGKLAGFCCCSAHCCCAAALQHVRLFVTSVARRATSCTASLLDPTGDACAVGARTMSVITD